MIVLDADYDRAGAGGPLPQPWPRELAGHGDLELLFSRPFDGHTGFDVAYVCRTCNRQGRMVAGGGDPEQLAVLASHLLAAQACA